MVFLAVPGCFGGSWLICGWLAWICCLSARAVGRLVCLAAVLLIFLLFGWLSGGVGAIAVLFRGCFKAVAGYLRVILGVSGASQSRPKAVAGLLFGLFLVKY